MKAWKSSKRSRQRKQHEAPTKPINADLLKRAISWIVDDPIFANVALHGNVTWKPAQLVSLAILWVWSSSTRLTGAFEEAKRLSEAMFGTVAVESYQGMMKALIRYTEPLKEVLWPRMHQLMETSGDTCWRIGVWLALAVDGSRISTPRTESNERAFASKTFGKSAKARSRKKWKNKRRRSKPLTPIKPQIWLTLLWHMGMKMPWAWRLGPSTSSERNHLCEMLRTLKLPAKTLICADAGFVGYEFWRDILGCGHQFLIRVGSNVHLLRKMGRYRTQAGLVYLWPDKAMGKRQPPIVLRLFEFQSGRGRIYLVTSVLSAKELSAAQASQLYRLRWGVELQFRTLKQTFGRGKLKSRTAEAALVELEWALLGLWMIQLFAIKEQIAIDLAPKDCSVSLAITIIRDAMYSWSEYACDESALELRLSQAVKDTYERRSSKKARFRPKSNDIPSAGKPIIVNASRKQRQAFEELNANAA